MTKEIEILNDNKTSLKYAVLVLSKIFELDEKEALAAAQNIDRHGSFVVFTGSDEAAAAKIDLLNEYNAATGNELRARTQKAGTYKMPRQEALENTAVTLRLNNFVFSDDMLEYLLKSLPALDKSIPKRINLRTFVDDLRAGKEVLVKEFEGEKAEASAKIFKEALEHVWEIDKQDDDLSEEDRENNENISLAIRAPGYMLEGEKTLLSDAEMKKRAKGALLADLATSLYESFTEEMVKQHGSIENYLKQASPKDIQMYHDLEEKMKEVEGLKKPAHLKIG